MTLTPDDCDRITAELEKSNAEMKRRYWMPILISDLEERARRVQDSLSSVMSVSGSIEAQKQAAIDIIVQGQTSGIDEIEIQMSQKAGLSLGSNVYGIPIEATVGGSGNMIIRVKYKR